MAKGRHLKPDFFTDKHVVSVSPLARLLYQGLWCHAADCGHLDDEPVEFKLRILPADNCDIDELLGELLDQGRITRGGGKIFVPTIAKHGRIDKRYETACEDCKARRENAVTDSPETRDHDGDTTGTQRDHDGTTRAGTPQHDADGDGDGDGEGDGEGEGEGRPRKRATPKRATQLPDGFEPNETNIQLAAAEGVDLRREFPKFCDYNRAKGSTYKDWHLALNNWIRKAAEYGGNVRPLPGLPEPNDWMRRRLK